jgi:hypothetical protein
MTVEAKSDAPGRSNSMRVCWKVKSLRSSPLSERFGIVITRRSTATSPPGGRLM